MKEQGTLILRQPDTDTCAVRVWQLLARSSQWPSKHVPHRPEESKQWTLKETQSECKTIGLCQQQALEKTRESRKMNTDQVGGSQYMLRI